MKKIYTTAKIYLILGLIAGVFYRDYTRWQGFTGQSQLNVLHTHLLVLGMVFFLIVLSLDRQFNLHDHVKFNRFYLSYNLGLIWTVTMMLVKGIMTVQGYADSAMVNGIAGLGHIIITFGLVWFFAMLKDRVGQAA